MAAGIDRRVGAVEGYAKAGVAKRQPRSLRAYLAFAAVILLAPLLLVGIAIAFYQSSSEREKAEHSAEVAAKLAAAAFDAETEVYRAAFRALAAFPDTAGLTSSKLRERMQTLLSKPHANLAFSFVPVPVRSGVDRRYDDSEGRSAGYRPADHLTSALEVSKDAKARLTLKAGPYVRDAEMVALQMKLPLERFSRRLAELLAAGLYTISIYDGTRELVSTSGAENVVSKETIETIGSSLESGVDAGRLANLGANGGEYVTFWHHMPDSDSFIAVSMEQFAPAAPFLKAFTTLLGLSILPLAGGLVSALFLARILSASQEQVLAAAAAMAHGRRIQPLRTPLKEANVVGRMLADASVQLEDSGRALKEANDRLERRIWERTAELHQKNCLIENTLNSLAQGVIHFGEKGEILLANRQAEQMFAEPWAKEMKPQDWAQLGFAVRPACLSMDVARLSSLQRGDGSSTVVTSRMPDGPIMEISRSELADGSTVCLFSDVSLHVQQASELQSARVLAEEANRAKDDFLTNMSHELRTPLNAVLGYAELLILDPSMSELNQQRIRRLQGAGMGLLALLNDLIDYSRITAGALTIESVSFDISEVVQEALSVVQPLASDKRLALDTELDETIPRQLIGDPNRIRQILINLLNNAVKFTHLGFVKLRVGSTRANDRDDVKLLLSIEDSGVGIPFDQQDRVFERFHQVNRSSDTLYRGAGLGLSICRHLVDQMGGKIWLRSAPEIGTTFTVSLPLGLGSPSAQSPADTSGVSRQLRILLADDVEISRDVTTQLIQTIGAAVDCVCDGGEAVEAVSRRRYDLVIMDLFMPGMDGYEAARQIRSNPATSNIPIIACSASPQIQESDLSEGLFDDVLGKPLDIRALRAMLDRQGSRAGDLGKDTMRVRRPSSRRMELRSLEGLIGTARLQAGLQELEAYLDDLISLDLSQRGNAVTVTAIAHAALTSSRLMGFDELFDHLLTLENPSLEREEILSAASTLRPKFVALRNDVALCRRQLSKGLTS